jgi:uncharacterized membrane protein YdjX (TVP38/TMEM64 family)
MPESAPRPNRALLVKLTVATVLAVVVAVLVARGLNLKAFVQQGLDLIRGAGPVAFFVAMAFLPALGVPMLAFALSAGPVFSERLGLGWVIVLANLMETLNLMMTYLLARRGLRPLFEKLVARLGYKLPQVEAGDVTDLIVILRVTPGVPFFAQNYLLGLAEVPFGKYVVLSCLIAWPLNTALMLFGDALLSGQGRMALIGLCTVLALTAGAHLVRKHYERHKKQP